MKRSRATELVSGLFLGGGPLRLSKRCRHGVPSAGAITVTNAATGTVVASVKVASGRLAKIPLVAGTYTITGTFADAFRNNEPIQAQPQTVTIATRTTVRQDVSAPIK